MGLLLSTDLHTVTHEQNQIFVEIVNRHMSATPRLSPATPLSQVNLNKLTTLAALGIGSCGPRLCVADHAAQQMVSSQE